MQRLVNEKKKEGNGSLDPRSACPAQPRETAEVVKGGERWGAEGVTGAGGGQRGQVAEGVEGRFDQHHLC